MKSTIVAYGKNNRVIGNKGDIPWMGHLPIDMKRVRELTTGQAIIMGYNTYKSIGKPLPNRQNIVLSFEDFDDKNDITIAKNIDEALKSVENGRETFIFGGASVYASTMDLVDKIYATEVYGDFEGDAFFPEIDMSLWQEISREHHPADNENKFAVDFVEYIRK